MATPFLSEDTIIDSVKIVRLTGPYKSTPHPASETLWDQLFRNNGVGDYGVETPWGIPILASSRLKTKLKATNSLKRMLVLSF